MPVPGFEIVPLPDGLIVAIFLGVVLLVLLSYLVGRAFGNGYHSEKRRQTKLLVDMLKEGKEHGSN
jgi:membrane protein DedA with SNARE-associated domain